MANHRTTCRQRYLSTGLTMVEILVTIIILSIGLLGLATLQLNALRNNSTAYERTQANTFAYSIIDRMRANSGAAADYVVAMGTGPTGAQNCASATATCTPTQMAAYDLDMWKCSLGKWAGTTACSNLGFSSTPVLADGDGSVSLNGSVVTVTIQWAEKRGRQGTAAASTTGQLTTFSLSTLL